MSTRSWASSRRRTATRRLNLAAAVLLALLAAPVRALKTETISKGGLNPAAGVSQVARVTSGQALLRFSVGTVDAQIDSALSASGVSRLKDLGSGWILAGWSDGASVSSRMASLAAIPGVLAAEPSNVYSVNRIPIDPLVGSQYALAKVDAFRGWEFEVGNSSRVTIAVIDTGIDGSHPDLAAKLTNTKSIAYDPNSGAVASPNDPLTPACEHATEVAGVAAAVTDNSLDVAGISWGAQLVSYKVFLDADCTGGCGSGSCITNDPAIISALNQAISVQNTGTHGRMVVNLSLGGDTNAACGGPLQTAVSNAVAAGVVVVAAAGNIGPGANSVSSPGNCTGVIPAGATDANDAIASFSSRGAALASNGLVAPGVSVLTTYPGGGTSSPSGTSFASPMVAGAAALIISAKPTLTPANVQTNLRAGADNIGQASTDQGAGRLNLYKSLSITDTGSLPPANGVNADAKPFAFPNPMRLSSGGGSEISIPPALQGSNLDIKVYTMEGKFVRELSAPLWDGKNANGNLVATGSYVFVVTTSAGSSRGRMAVIR